MASLAGVIGAPAVAGAHGGEGEMTVIIAEQSGDRQVTLEVGLLYENDDDLAIDATVTVTGTGPEGATLAATPLPLEAEGAKYKAAIDLPVDGAWAFTITSTDPVAAADATVTVAALTSTTPAVPTTAETTAAPATTTTTGVPIPETGTDSSDGRGGSSTGILIGVGVAAVALVGGGLYLRSRKTGTEPDAG